MFMLHISLGISLFSQLPSCTSEVTALSIKPLPNNDNNFSFPARSLIRERKLELLYRRIIYLWTHSWNFWRHRTNFAFEMTENILCNFLKYFLTLRYCYVQIKQINPLLKYNFIFYWPTNALNCIKLKRLKST